jgi:hypothetical protein
MDGLSGVAILSILGWSFINAAILSVTAPFALRSRVKVFSALLAAAGGIVALGVPAILLMASPFGRPFLEATQTEMRPFLQLLIGFVVFAVGALFCWLLLRKSDGTKISMLGALRAQAALMLVSVVLRATLYFTGLSPIFAWF